MYDCDPRKDELLRRLRREPQSVADKEQQQLDLMELVILRCAATSLSSLDGAAITAAMNMLPQPGRWGDMVLASETSPIAWKICRTLVAALRIVAPGHLLGSPLRAWAFDVAQGTRIEPRQRGRDPFANIFRDAAIVKTVESIRDLGLRCATTSKPDGSACHLVADRLGYSYETIRGIWKRHLATILPDAPFTSPHGDPS